jgi:hypothetical protein
MEIGGIVVFNSPERVLILGFIPMCLGKRNLFLERFR